MNKKYKIIFLLVWMVSFGINAQVNNEITTPKELYSDRITDENGSALSGIKVRVKGSGLSTYTDHNGDFSIDAKNGDVIILSKNGRIINTYRLNGSIYYEVEDKSEEIVSERSKTISKSYNKRKVNNSKKFKAELDSAIIYKSKDPTLSVDYLGNALNFANNKSEIAQAYIVLGDVYMSLKQYDLAVSNYKIALDNVNSNSNLLNLAKAYLLNNELTESESLFKRILENKKASSQHKIQANEGLGDVYFKAKKYDNSLKNYLSALKLNKQTNKNSSITILNSKIANVHEAKGETKKAETYLLDSKNSILLNDNPKNKVIENQRTADFYSRINSIDKEVEARKQILSIYEDSDLDEIITDSIILTKPKAKLNLGAAYLKQRNYDDAIVVLEETVIEAEGENDLKTQKEAVQKLSEAYVFLGDDDKALRNYKKYVALVDILYKQKENEINEAVSLSNDLSFKQNRIFSLEKDRELSESKLKLYQAENELTIESYNKQKIIIYSLVFGIVLLLLSLFWMFRSNKQRRISNNLLALKSLRTQMNPHFIFNALNSVNSFISQNDERSANRYLTDFSMLMRSVLENSEEDFIPLEKEVELLKLYLKLEHSRFQDKFEYELFVDKNIALDQFQIPPMLLQPYVENAVWHGLRYKKEKGFLNVKLYGKDKETLQIEITDNGIGRKKSKELKTDYQKKKKSKGMYNIQQRIAILNDIYMDKIDVSIEDLEGQSGTKVVLTLKKIVLN